MAAKFVLFTLICICVYECTGQFLERVFVSVIKSDTNTTEETSVVDNSETLSVIECAVKCSSVGCDAINYDVRSGQCKALHTNIPGVIQPATNGTQTFITRRNDCPSGWFQYRKQCFIFGNEKMHFRNAKNRCTRLGAVVAELQNDDVYEYIRRMTRHFGESVYIGIHYDQDLRSFVWYVSRNRVDTGSRWATGKPGGSAPCVVIDRELNYTLSNVWCPSDYFYICQLTMNLY